MIGSLLAAREVSASPQGWGLVVGGVVLVLIGGFLALQGWAFQSDVPRSDKWRGLPGLFGFQGFFGFLLLPIGVLLVDVGLAERRLGWLAVSVTLAAAGLVVAALRSIRAGRRVADGRDDERSGGDAGE